MANEAPRNYHLHGQSALEVALIDGKPTLGPACGGREPDNTFRQSVAVAIVNRVFSLADGARIVAKYSPDTLVALSMDAALISPLPTAGKKVKR